MAKALTAFLMIFMLMFGSVGVPAFADAGTGGHAVEMVDLECHAEEKSDGDQEQGSPKAPAGHVDHHHCSVAIPHNATGMATNAKFMNDAFLHLSVRGLISHQTAPPTQPPSA
jgi:hypothetical protein